MSQRMDLLTPALRGAANIATTASPQRPTLLIAGAGGRLGSEVLAQALGEERAARVQALVHEDITSSMRGFVPVLFSTLPGAMPSGLLHAVSAVIVFERARHSNRRDEVFVMPDPAQLLALATTLRHSGVSRLMVVVPHAPALLPSSLRGGFASHDEAAVAALGFEHVLFLRSAQAASSSNTRHGALQRFASWWLSQLSWMVPQSQQPVRVVRLAALVVELLRLQLAAPAGTRVMPPEVLSQAAQAASSESLLRDWLQQGPG